MRSAMRPLLSRCYQEEEIEREEKWRVFVPSERVCQVKLRKRKGRLFLHAHFMLNKIVLFELELLYLKEMRLVKGVYVQSIKYFLQALLMQLLLYIQLLRVAHG